MTQYTLTRWWAERSGSALTVHGRDVNTGEIVKLTRCNAVAQHPQGASARNDHHFAILVCGEARP